MFVWIVIRNNYWCWLSRDLRILAKTPRARLYHSTCFWKTFKERKWKFKIQNFGFGERILDLAKSIKIKLMIEFFWRNNENVKINRIFKLAKSIKILIEFWKNNWKWLDFDGFEQTKLKFLLIVKTNLLVKLVLFLCVVKGDIGHVVVVIGFRIHVMEPKLKLKKNGRWRKKIQKTSNRWTNWWFYAYNL